MVDDLLGRGLSMERTEPLSRSSATNTRLVRWLMLLSAGFLLGELLIVVWRPPPLFDPDESLFANVAREMIATGDYLTPRYRGESFHDRPALYYWLLAGAVHWIGDTELAYRIPSMLLAFVTVIVCGQIARDLFGSLAGAATLLVAATVAAQPVLALAVSHDAALSALLLWPSGWAGAANKQNQLRAPLPMRWLRAWRWGWRAWPKVCWDWYCRRSHLPPMPWYSGVVAIGARSRAVGSSHSAGYFLVPGDAPRAPGISALLFCRTALGRLSV